MPNPTKITTVTGDKEWQALLAIREARTVLISSADITADANGKKIITGGTILGSAVDGQSILLNNASAKIVNDATAEGIVVSTVDATYGDIEAAMAFVGTAAIAKMPTAPTDEAMSAMSRMTFMDA